MLLDLCCREAFVWVSLEDFVDQVDALGREPLGHLELATQNLLVKLGGRLVLKGQVTGHHCEEDDSAGPDIDAGTIVLKTVDHLRRRIAR